MRFLALCAFIILGVAPSYAQITGGCVGGDTTPGCQVTGAHIQASSGTWSIVTPNGTLFSATDPGSAFTPALNLTYTSVGNTLVMAPTTAANVTLQGTGGGTVNFNTTKVTGTLNVTSSYQANGTAGVSCAAASVSLTTFVVTNGIVTHC